MKIKIFILVWLGGFLFIYGFNDIAAAGWAMFAPIIYLFIIGVCESTKALNWVVRQLLNSATGHERIEADIGPAELVYIDWDKPKEKERAKALLYEEQKGYCPGCLEKRAGKQVPEGIGKAADVLRKMDDLECMERRNKVRAR